MVELNPKLLDVVEWEEELSAQNGKRTGTVVDRLEGLPGRVLIEISNSQGVPVAFVSRPEDEVAVAWAASESPQFRSEVSVAQQAFENGVLFLQNGMYAPAKEQLRIAFEADTNLVKALFASANSLAEKRALGAAMSVYRMILELQPGYEPARQNLIAAHGNRGVEAARKGLFSQAIEDFDQALALQPPAQTVDLIRRNIVATYTQYAILLSSMKQYGPARQIFQLVFELEPSEKARKNFAIALIASSVAATELGAQRRTEELFRQPLLMGLTLSECLNVYGATLAGRGEFQEALQSLRAALEADPNNRTAEENLARLNAGESNLVFAIGIAQFELRTPERFSS